MASHEGSEKNEGATPLDHLMSLEFPGILFHNVQHAYAVLQ